MKTLSAVLYGTAQLPTRGAMVPHYTSPSRTFLPRRRRTRRRCRMFRRAACVSAVPAVNRATHSTSIAHQRPLYDHAHRWKSNGGACSCILMIRKVGRQSVRLHKRWHHISQSSRAWSTPKTKHCRPGSRPRRTEAISGTPKRYLARCTVRKRFCVPPKKINTISDKRQFCPQMCATNPLALTSEFPN